MALRRPRECWMRTSLKTTIAILSILLVFSIAWFDVEQPSPGPLSPTHAKVLELQGRDGCITCHGSGPKELASSCLACHEPVEVQLEKQRGIHGKLSGIEQMQCGVCHPEHFESTSAHLVDFSFSQAELEQLADFQHQTVDFHLDGRHNDLQCVDCHQNATAETLEKGGERFIAETQDCISCHDDPHEGAMQRGCADCHGQEHAFENLEYFPHDLGFPLHGSHGDLDCTACHKKDSSYSVEALSDRFDTQPWRTCVQCHDSPHSAGFLAESPKPPAANLPSLDQCVLCHSESHQEFFGEEVVWEDRWHAASGFALEAPHADLSCTECHGERTSIHDFDLRYPGRKEVDCASCHNDPHQGQFDHEPYLEKGCLSCHRQDAFQPHEFDVEFHNKVSFLLEDSHAQTECIACHGLADAAKEDSRIFHNTKQECSACHKNVHSDSFDETQGACAQCHQATQFPDLTKEFDHEAWTKFPLTQGHAEQNCEACHARSPEPNADGRTLGLVSLLHPGTPESCLGCHADVHLGSFDAPGLPTSLEDRMGCARCHSTESFTALHPNSFDHDQWTTMPLDGAHAQAECISCHGAGTDQSRLGKVKDHFQGDPAQCTTCHQDPHEGDFDAPHLRPTVFGRDGCVRCHQTTSFQQIEADAFHHGTWTGFDLRGAHFDAACISCHSPNPPSKERERRMARAVGKDCTDCHSDPHAGQFMEHGQQDCLRCHDANTESFLIPQFDHLELTNFKLDQDHARLACVDCHKPATTERGETITRYRPLGTSCSDCHDAGIQTPGLRLPR